jgi:hypothetical protein
MSLRRNKVILFSSLIIKKCRMNNNIFFKGFTLMIIETRRCSCILTIDESVLCMLLLYVLVNILIVSRIFIFDF